MKPEISIEFFPPPTAEGADKLRATWIEEWNKTYGYRQ